MTVLSTLRPSRRILAALAGLLLLGSTVGCGAAFAAAPPAMPPAVPAAPAPAAEPVITIMGFVYRGDTTVAAGATVTVVNRDRAPHTLTASDGSFRTPIIPAGGSATFTAPVRPGQYAFGCDVHSSMSGTLTVVPASPSDPGPTVSPTVSPTPSAGPSSPPPAAPLVTIRGFAYQGDLTVPAGTVLTVRNDDAAPHTFTDAGGLFSTPVIPAGGSVTLQLPATPGSHRITCNVHSFMMGTLTLTAPPPAA